MERYFDALERIAAFQEEETVREPFRSYFLALAVFAEVLSDFSKEFLETDVACCKDTERLMHYNALFYEDLHTDYAHSFANPSYAVEQLGAYGQLLSALYMEVRGLAPLAYEKRFAPMAAVLETVIQIYCMFEEGYLSVNIKTGEKLLPSVKEVQDVFYSYCYDYSEDLMQLSMDGCYRTDDVYLRRIVEQAEMGGAALLYRTGEYVTEDAKKTAAYLANCSEETIALMARTWYQGFVDGFRIAGKPYEKKKTVELLYEAGFERVVQKTLALFAADGVQAAIPRSSRFLMTKNPAGSRGYYASPNRQMDYDHSYDLALVMGENIVSRLLEERKNLFASYGALCADYAGPAVLEVFGEPEFAPKDTKEALRFSAHQKEVYGRYRNENLRLTHQYIREEERSFTIIAWPLPSIGADYEAIFAETIKVNTMESAAYRDIQQKLIDALDEAVYVEVRGKKGVPSYKLPSDAAGDAAPYFDNETCMRVMLHPLADPKKQTNFENCLSDVNIPLGEVFTSPLLTGTEGLLHVGSVYIGGIRFVNLRLRFENGRVVSYSCDNFADEEAGRALMRRTIFAEKEHLPLGEFAIGTNTVAYAMAERYGIGAKLPILIAEKMGPHFAVGDTCYSFAEELAVYNPDGKEIIARDNECSILRKSKPEEAYFACHCDITIPYRELDTITAVTADGRRICLIADGRFVLAGTEALNEPLGSL